MPRRRSIGFMPAATDLQPSEKMARVSTVAVVVPSPATCARRRPERQTRIGRVQRRQPRVADRRAAARRRGGWARWRSQAAASRRQ
eukprot:7381602-Prymnesium_polylepis.2